MERVSSGGGSSFDKYNLTLVVILIHETCSGNHYKASHRRAK